jgi:8-oxo-dGTP diphosphatase
MIDVTCAIIRNEDDEILIVQRGEKTDHPFKWEFPGGKTNQGESWEDCIVREISEELSMDIVICGKLNNVEYDYGFKRIRLIPFICDTLDDLPLLSEHIGYKWIAAAELPGIDFSGADVVVAGQYVAGLSPEPEHLSKESTEKSLSETDEADLKQMISGMMSRQEAEWLANSAVSNPAIFAKLIQYSYSDERKLAFRASWTVTKVCDQYPDLIRPHFLRIVESIPEFDNESVQRSFLRIISQSDLKELDSRLHGILAGHCFEMLKSGFSAIAIKAYSMEILYKLTVIYPELGNELSTSIKILMEDSSGGIKARGRMILEKIREIPLDSGPGLK